MLIKNIDMYKIIFIYFIQRKSFLLKRYIINYIYFFIIYLFFQYIYKTNVYKTNKILLNINCF